MSRDLIDDFLDGVSIRRQRVCAGSTNGRIQPSNPNTVAQPARPEHTNVYSVQFVERVQEEIKKVSITNGSITNFVELTKSNVSI